MQNLEEAGQKILGSIIIKIYNTERENNKKEVYVTNI
jgi:hypothetical protein